MSRSYDSSKEDAQNPFPPPTSTLPGKAAFQSGKAGKRPIPSSESLETTIYTPSPKTKSFDRATSMTKKVNHALRRPQTVDMQSTPERANQAKNMKRALQDEFEAAQEQAKMKADEYSHSSPKAAAKAKCKPSPKTKAEGKAKARAKATACPSKAKEVSPSSKRSRKDEDDDGDSMKDHATARGSNQEMPGKRRRTKSSPVSKNSSPVSKNSSPPSKKSSPPSKKASPPSTKASPPSTEASPPRKASHESLPEAKVQKTCDPSPKPAAEATADAEDPKLSEKLLAKKREAHKLYMRFHRSINGGSPSFTYPT